jgi:hypothetical protein
VRHARETRALRSPIAFELLGADHPWYVQPAVEERAAARLCCLLMAPPLAEAVEAGGGVIYSAPPVMARPVHGQNAFSLGPVSPGRWAAPPPLSVVVPHLPTPCADGCVGHGATAVAQAFWPIAGARGAPRGEPDTVADAGAGKAVLVVTRGVGRRYQAWFLILLDSLHP